MPLQAEGRNAAVLVGAVLVAIVPFSAKAFHIDDVYFAEVAGTILRLPLDPYAGAVALEDVDYRVFAAGGRCPDTFTSMSHPPLVPYAIALVARMAGGFSELWLHLSFIPFAIGAAFAACSLASRFTDHRLATTLLLVSSPIFTLSAQSLMTDLPALAFSLAALALLVRGVDREQRGPVVTAGVLLGLAVLTRYSAILTFFVMLAYASGRGRLRRALPAVVGLVLVVGVWSAQNLVYHGQLHIVASSGHYRLFYAGQSFDSLGLLKKTLADLSGLGGTSFGAAALLLLAGSRRRAAAFGAAAAATASVFLLRPESVERLATYSAREIIAVSLCAACGALLLTEAFWPRPTPDTRRALADPRGDQAFLVAWLSVSLGGALLLLPFGTARYMLPVLPPLFILLVRRAESSPFPRRTLHVGLGLAIAQGFALSLLLAAADDESATRYRLVAQGIRQSHPQQTIWFVGEWGFRYYMRQVGGRYLRSTDEAPGPGDIIIRPEIAGMHEMSPGVRSRAVRIQEIPLQSRLPIRLMSFDAKAGYYSHHWGYLPWAFSRSPLETIEVFEVRAPAPPPAPDPCASS